MADEHQSSRRIPVPILSRDNKDDWFAIMRLHLESKDLWRLVTRPIPNLTPSSTGSSTIFPTVETPGPATLAGFGDQKHEAEAKFAMIQCVDHDDREIIRDLPTSGSMWQALQAKYNDFLQVTNRQLHAKYVSFQKDPEKSIDNTIGEINSMARKLVAFSSAMAPMATKEQRFAILLHSLPKDYETIVDSFDAQSGLNLDHAMRVLQEKEATLEAEESANWAKRSGRPPIQQRGSRPSLREGKSRSYRKESSSDDERTKCFLCDSKKHRARECPEAKEFRRWRRAKSKPKDVKNKDKDKHKEKGKSSRKGHRAFAAGSSSEDESTSSESDDEEEVGYETAALSKELADSL